MAQVDDTVVRTSEEGAGIGQILLAVGIIIVSLAVLYAGFLFLGDRSTTFPKWFVTIFAIVWGVVGVALLFWSFNNFAEKLPLRWTQRIQPYIFVGPAIFLLFLYLLIPAIDTFRLSLYNRDGTEFVGIANYVELFTGRLLQEAIRNNLMWIIFGSTTSVAMGLLIAVLADRSKWERLSKSLIFLPMAISFVGAGVIWNFMYEVRPAELPQIGLLNAIVVGLGGDPKSWYAWVDIAPWNNLFLIVIVVWLQVGFAMVLFSAALKGIPDELLEAGRVDGATEIQIFFRIMVPYIMPTIITVWTTIVIFTLKIFDVVWVMTGGQFGTHVIATQFYRQAFTARNSGVGSAIAIILLLAVIPVLIYNLRQFREQEAF
jgi:alpha-glucoside transport system permease protein